MSVCIECNGTGKITLLNTEITCPKCGGGGGSVSSSAPSGTYGENWEDTRYRVEKVKLADSIPHIDVSVRSRRVGEPVHIQYLSTSYIGPNTANVTVVYGREPLIREGEGYYHAVTGPFIGVREGNRLYIDGRDISDECCECNLKQGWALLYRVIDRGQKPIFAQPIEPYVAWGQLEVRK